ncbi:ribosome maturation factor RimM [Clostridium sp. WILCCON 0269]|uniref:Ribosome maturation factor RimM n=1 Tax=Candidatus Clostridium eludens TaxID=3381663 RepID=A0ABW8SJS1_9CLOT
MKEFITVGQIINTHGIKGELKVYPLTDDIKRFKDLKSVYVEGILKNIIGCKLQAKKVILKIEGIDSIEKAMAYKGKYLEVPRKDAVKLEEGRYFVVDMIGCRVIDEKGVYYGKISEVLHTYRNDVYWIKGHKELLIPAIEDIVVKVDVEKGEIIIKPVETWM